MDVNSYKKEICNLVKESQDIEYLRAVFTFAVNYPDKSKKQDKKSILNLPME